jgi:hypothetical protein
MSEGVDHVVDPELVRLVGEVDGVVTTIGELPVFL